MSQQDEYTLITKMVKKLMEYEKWMQRCMNCY